MPYDIYHKRRRFNKDKKNKNVKKIDNKDIINKIKYCEKQGKYDFALNYVDQYLLNNPDNDYMQTYRAMILFRLRRNEEALDLLNTLLNKDNISKRDYIFAMSQYAHIYEITGDTDTAIYYYEKIVNESEYPELISRGKLAELYSRKGRYEDAIKVLTIDGFNNMYLNVKRAKIYIKEDKYNEALNSLNESEYNDKNIAIKENFDEKYKEQEREYVLGHIYYKQDRFNMALPHLYNGTSVKNNSSYINSYIDIAKIYILRSKIDDAITILEDLKKNSYSDFYTRIVDELIAKAYTKKNDYTKAKEQYSNINTDERQIKINLGKIELCKGYFNKAEEYLSNIDIGLDDITNKYDDFYKLLLVKVRLKKYDEAKELLCLFRENMQRFSIKSMEYELNRIDIYIKNELNEEIGDIPLSYSQKQIISYNEDAAIKHIIDHHVNNYRTSKFNENIDINKFFYEIKDNLSNSNIIYDSLLDKYTFKYNNIGYDRDNSNIHQLLVLTLPNTNNIITMYPYNGSDSIFNITELEENDKPKVKRLSQIEKFNSKYGKK